MEHMTVSEPFDQLRFSCRNKQRLSSQRKKQIENNTTICCWFDMNYTGEKLFREQNPDDPEHQHSKLPVSFENKDQQVLCQVTQVEQKVENRKTQHEESQQQTARLEALKNCERSSF